MNRANHPILYIVDDDEAVRSSLGLLAEAQGWQVRVFESAAAYLESPPHLNDMPICLVLDLQMPDMDGAELLEKLQSEDCGVPTIVLTAWPEGDLARRARLAGARQIIGKPFEPSEWLRAVETVLDTSP